MLYRYITSQKDNCLTQYSELQLMVSSSYGENKGFFSATVCRA
jgi:hypothetical protein